VEKVITAMLEQEPSAGDTHWSTRSMASETGMPQSAVPRIRRTFGHQSIAIPKLPGNNDRRKATVGDLPSTSDERPSMRPHGEARNRRPPPAWLGRLSIYIASPIGIIDYFVAAAGDTNLVLEATAVALAALIAAGCARVTRAAPSMILVGLAYLIVGAAVIGWGEILAGVAMIFTGAVAVTFGAAMIGPRTIAARARHLAERATKARRT
jgi:hypothetical protein